MSTNKSTVLFLFLLFTFSKVNTNAQAQNEMIKNAYLFYYFEGYAGERAGLYLSYSYDLHTWKKIAGKIISPAIGEYKVFRDPCVLKTPDSKFHLVWTTGKSGFGYANSDDGFHWKNEKFVIVEDKARGFDFANVWAPELYFENDTTYIIWSSTLKKDYVPPADSAKWWSSTWNHRFYYTSTTDFESFKPTKPFWDAGFNSIDATVYKTDSLYYLFYKDERKSGKNVIQGTAENLFGPYENTQQVGYKLTEGAIAVPTDSAFVLYYDYYHEYNGYRYITTKDMKTWSSEILPEKDGFVDVIRHGSIVKVSHEELEVILRLKE